jgi:hypothetical protein
MTVVDPFVWRSVAIAVGVGLGVVVLRLVRRRRRRAVPETYEGEPQPRYEYFARRSNDGARLRLMRAIAAQDRPSARADGARSTIVPRVVPTVTSRDRRAWRRR